MHTNSPDETKTSFTTDNQLDYSYPEDNLEHRVSCPPWKDSRDQGETIHLTTRKQTIGRWGEDTAGEYLEGLGYTILARNVHTPHGEIDIIATKNQVLVFVEVKTRTSHSFAFPEEAVTPRKQAHMLSAAELYLNQHPECSDTWHFDVIAIVGKPGEEAQIEHFENVIG